MIFQIDDDIQKNVRKIVTEHPKMISFSGGKGSSSGDAFLIATAMKYMKSINIYATMQTIIEMPIIRILILVRMPEDLI